MGPFSSQYDALSTDESEVVYQSTQSSWLRTVQNFFSVSGSTHRQSWLFFVSACVASLVLSTINITLLSASASFRALPKPQVTPSVYIGLENLPPRAGRCRSRMTFPKSFYTVHDDDIQHRMLLHAPDDRMMLKFGDRTSTVLHFYVPDYGLENCTFTAQFADDAARRPQMFELEVYALQGADSLATRHRLAVLVFHKADGTHTTGVFYCPSRTHISLQIRCPSSACALEFPLEGVTSMTASADSLSKTGFRITQYEAPMCAHR